MQLRDAFIHATLVVVGLVAVATGCHGVRDGAGRGTEIATSDAPTLDAIQLTDATPGIDASLTWTASNVLHAWAGYNDAFAYIDSDGYTHFGTTIGGKTPDTFWQSAEEIDLAVDAYVWAETNDWTNLASYANEVESLCDGFVELHTDTWTTDPFNDDLDVAIIAFTRAYVVTGTQRWLTDAENNFDAVWTRAQAGDGALCERTGSGCYQNSSVNWTFAIASQVLALVTGTPSYLADASSVYAWAKAHLTEATGEVLDGPTEHDDYSYNYGYAIGAAALAGDAPAIASMAAYLMTDMTAYAGTVGGYKILPNYGQAALDNDGGFNGITLRWIGVANALALLDPSVLAWARANAAQAWAMRDAHELIWDNWMATTPPAVAGNAVYSWDCSSGLAALLDIPPSPGTQF